MSHLRRRALSISSLALVALTSGCASYIEGSKQPPFDWVADAPSSRCEALSGNYWAGGMPAPANAHAVGYGAVWPAEGSLLSIVERGTNATPRKPPRRDDRLDPADIVPALSIIIDESGKILFEAKNAKGEQETLSPQAWTCTGGALTNLVSLNSPNYDSYVQLWKSGNDLIAEQTIRATGTHGTGSGAQRPVARFHFRFTPMD
jgi:hypothetical protein